MNSSAKSNALKHADKTVALTAQLIALPSVTPQDAGVQDVIAKRLRQHDFQIERLERDGRKNLWAEYGEQGPLFVFGGHTDVVPAGEEEAWTSPPFEPTIRNGRLYGRGVQDMKGEVAAFITAAERFIERTPKPNFRVGIAIAGDEEHDYNFGTDMILEYLLESGRRVDIALVGEPTSTDAVGDTVKIGRRGSITGVLRIFGRQGHAAHPHRALNAIEKALPVLSALQGIEWDRGNDHFGPSIFQLTNLQSGTGAANVIPGLLQATFNLRYSTELTPEVIRQRIEKELSKCEVLHEITWIHGASPFLTQPGPLVDLVSGAVAEVLHTTPELSTSGGTSDARFFAARGIQVVELGMTNDTIHQIDENAEVAALQSISKVYERILDKLHESSRSFEG